MFQWSLLYLRKINSRASLDQSLDSGGSFDGTGGLVGQAIGNEFTRNISFELNTIGIPGLKVIIKGNKKVGGLVGTGSNFDIRGLNEIYASLDGIQAVGGAVGEVTDSSPSGETHISDTKTEILVSLFTGSSAEAIGGIVGEISNDATTYIKGTFSKLTIYEPSGTKSYSSVGGVLGRAVNFSTKDLFINNTKAFFNYLGDGGQIGGIIGEYLDASFSLGSYPAVIANSLAEGSINQASSSMSINIQRGGFIGSVSGGSSVFSISKFTQIKGHSEIGGAYGKASTSGVKEVFLDIGELAADFTNPKLGGVVGYQMTDEVSAYTNSKVKVTNLTHHNSGVCGTVASDTCGNIIGAFDTAPSSGGVFESILHTNASGSSGVNCGALCSAGLGSFISTDDTTCSTINDPFGFAIIDSICRPQFEYSWHENSKNNADVFTGYLAGNYVEPFPIFDGARWNSIGDDVFLMDKYSDRKYHKPF